MPKNAKIKFKPKKAMVKRIKVTARGKMLRGRPGTGHLKSRKSPKRLRRMRIKGQVPKQMERTYKRLMAVG